MASSVFYRFKSQKEPSRVAFDGTGISVFELKKEIITQSKLGDGTDFELVVSAEDSNEVYDDDTSIVPRSTTVVAKRLPAARPGRGGAARYVSGKMPQSSKTFHRQETASNQGHSGSLNAPSVVSAVQSEEERIAATLQMGADDWAQQSQQLANVAPVHRAGAPKNRLQGEANRPLPQGYICNRCGEKGHWIWDCPTNNDPAYDNRPRIKRTTGIPKSFLKTVEKPSAVVVDGTTDDKKQPTGVMVNSEGEWVVAEPDQAAWDKYQAQAKTSAAAQDAAAQGSEDLRRLGLECSIDKRLFIDPTKTPCCGTTYCHECIHNALLDNGLRCPHCQTENVLISDLRPDEEVQLRVRQYQEEMTQTKLPDKNKDEEKLSEVQVNQARSPKTVDPSKARVTTAPARRPQSPLVNGKGAKKRLADVALDTDRQAKSPKPTSKPVIGSESLSNPAHIPAISQASKPADPQPLNMTTAGMNNFMGMGMPFNMAMPNPMMMTGAQMLAPGWNNNAWMMGQNPFLFTSAQQQMATGFDPGVTAQATGTQAYGQATGSRFANQQRSHNEEDSAYFRRPVNPYRQNRRNWAQRPADYREI